MCCQKFSWTIFIFLVLFTLVTGSCLEFGHSCWGAHGKRSGNRATIAGKQPTPLVDNLAEQLYNNNNNVNSIDDESNSNNNNNNNNIKDYTLPQAASALASSSASDSNAAERNRDVNEAKWRQLLRQHRYQLRQMQRQFDASDAADSWRKLQQALAEAEQQQQQQQQQQLLPIADFYELAN